MSRNARLSIFLSWMVVSLACDRGPEQNTLARVGSHDITVDEFRSRFALTPYFAQFPSADPQTRILVLASLIGEKMLAEEAVDRGLDQTDRFRAIYKQLKKEAVIEKLLDDLFSDVKVSPEEIQEGLRKSQRVLEVQELVFETWEEAELVRRKIDASKSLLNGNGQPEQHLQQTSTYRIKWGDSEPEIEEVLWNLKVGQVSQPVQFKKHYYLFKVAGEQFSFPSRDDLLTLQPQIKSKIERLKRRRGYNSFFKSLMAGKRTQVPAARLREIAEQLEQALDIPPANATDTTYFEPILMSEETYLRASHTLKNRLDEPLVTFDDGSFWTIADFLRNLRHGPYPLNYASKGRFRTSLRDMAITMMEQEYVAREGVRRGLDKSAYVREEVRTWMDSYLADQMRLGIIASLAERSRSPRSRNGSDGRAASSSVSKRERIMALDEYLAHAVDKFNIEVNKHVLDTLAVDHLNMMVFKRHFPGRQAAPAILPLDRLQKYFSKIYGKITQ